MSNNTSSQKLRRNVSPSTNKSSGPLRATIPVSLMSQIHDVPEDSSSSSQNVWNKINAPHSGGNCGVSKQSSPWRLRQWSPTPKENYEVKERFGDYPATIRRTASLDAIYLKGQWPRDTGDYGSNLLLDKATQTPEEWVDMKMRFSCRVEASPSRDKKQKQRLLLGAHNPSLNQQYSSGSVSPNRVAVSTNTEHQHNVLMSDRKEQSRAIPVPPPPTSQSSRARNSVEGFNTEIEKLVWRGHEVTSNNKMMEPTPDGHRAPIAELFKHNTCRSVDTQTPVNAYSTNSSSGASSPCGSVSPWGTFDHHHSSRPPSGGTVEEIGEYNSLSPEDFQGLSLGTSPRGRFLCREPPDGCEKVETLKVVEHPVKNGQHGITLLYCPPKPSAQFVLQPSSSSAFCSLNKLTSSSAVKSSSSSHLFHHGSGSDLASNELSDRSSSVPPQWPVPTVVQIPAAPSGQAI